MKGTTMVTLALALWSSNAAFGAQMGIGDIALERCSVAQRSRSDKPEVAAFLNKIHGLEDSPDALKPNEIQEFEWVDLVDDGACELVMTLSFGPNCAALEIDWQDHSQVLPGGANLETRDVSMGGKEKIFKSSIRDLNGDGKKEIIMYSYLDPAGDRAGGGVTPVWPQVYRLEGEKYVPASKNFPEFYEDEVLPKLDREIGATPYPGDTVVAALEMQRDKIQRVLGLDPQAGLGEARQWATSGNPEMIEDARDVFLNIQGHEAEARAAEEAEKQALQRQREAAQ
jgi:hypothetical protein